MATTKTKPKETAKAGSAPSTPHPRRVPAGCR